MHITLVFQLQRFILRFHVVDLLAEVFGVLIVLLVPGIEEILVVRLHSLDSWIDLAESLVYQPLTHLLEVGGVLLRLYEGLLDVELLLLLDLPLQLLDCL